jgi:hypothetical protein
MDDRLHEALDNDLRARELTPALSAELEATRALLNGVVRAIPTRPLPDLGDAVRRRIDAADPALRLHRTGVAPRRGGVGAWLWSPRQMTLSIRPAYALAAALLIAVVSGTYSVLRTTGQPRGVEVATRAATETEVLVRFQLAAPHAQNVKLAGDFSNWSPAYSMQRSAPGVWTIVVPLAPGVHEYAFIVDGQKWVADPAAPPTPDGFGGTNSRVAVLSPDRA